MPLLLFLFSLVFGAGSSGIANPFGSQLIQPTLIAKAPCYQIEAGVKVTVDGGSLTSDDCRTRIDSKTYVRVRQKVKIVNPKITEGLPFTGNCVAGSSRLRKIGSTADGREVWWLDKNYLNNDTSDFIFIFLEKDESKHTFDIYIDEAEKDKLATDPKYEFVRNCKETGGIVPVLEGPATPTFPPQTVTLMLDCSQYPDPKPKGCDYNGKANQEFIITGADPKGVSFDFQTIYASFKSDLEGKYFMRIQEQIRPSAAQQVGVLKKTIGSEVRYYDSYFHAGIVYLVGRAGVSGDHAGKSWMYNPTDEEPPLGVGWYNPSLQLGQIKFITTSDWTWATPECKPALYLYPEKPTKLQIKLQPAGQLTMTDPPYDQKKGWEVVAYPDGTLTPITNYSITNYPYLYYEAEIEKVKTPKKGWVVKQEELASFFNKLLPLLGLNQKESQEFKNYWLEVLKQAPYYFVGFLEKEEIERIEPIRFSLTPTTFIRVRLFFEPLQTLVLVEQPDIPLASKRSGFTAVDWGGILASGSCKNGEAENQKSR